MKYLFLVLISLPILADTNYIKLSELDKCSGGATYYAQKETCGEDCIAIESSDNCKDLELTDNLVLDFIRKEHAEPCIDEADCIAKEAALVCDLGKPIRTENEVYCAVEAYKKVGKKLVNNPEKKAAREAAEKAQEEAQKAKEAKCANFVFKGTNSASIVKELNEWRECKK